jgi:hypothetical protein
MVLTKGSLLSCCPFQGPVGLLVDNLTTVCSVLEFRVSVKTAASLIEYWMTCCKEQIASQTPCGKNISNSRLLNNTGCTATY